MAEDRIPEFKDARYTADGRIDVTINHPEFGWLRWTANKNDPEESLRAIYDAVAAGEVAPYEPPEGPNDAELLEQRLAWAKERRDERMVQGTMWNGWALPCDDKSITRYNAEVTAVLVGSRSANDVWKFPHGYEIVSNDGIKQMGVAARLWVQRCYKAESVVVGMIENGRRVNQQAIRDEIDRQLL